MNISCNIIIKAHSFVLRAYTIMLMQLDVHRTFTVAEILPGKPTLVTRSYLCNIKLPITSWLMADSIQCEGKQSVIAWASSSIHAPHNTHIDMTKIITRFIQRMHICCWRNPDSKVHGANMGPTWALSDPDGPHVAPMNLSIKEVNRVWNYGTITYANVSCGYILCNVVFRIDVA